MIRNISIVYLYMAERVVLCSADHKIKDVTYDMCWLIYMLNQVQVSEGITEMFGVRIIDDIYVQVKVTNKV